MALLGFGQDPLWLDLEIEVLSLIKLFQPPIEIVASQLVGHRAPPADGPLKTFIAWFRQIEFVGWKALEATEHVPEDLRIESRVLPRGFSAQILEPITIGDSGKVHEISGLSSSKDGQHFVDGQLLCGNRRSEGTTFEGKNPGIRPEVDLGDLGTFSNLETDKIPMIHDTEDFDPCSEQSLLNKRDDR